MIGWRQLPIPLAPARQETLASWLHRLAVVHGLPTAELRHHLRIGTRTGDPDEVRELAGRLASVTGYPTDRRAGALPELREPAPDWTALRHVAQRACPRCTARHESGPVRRLFAHHEYLCIRHGYWIGPPDPTRDDPPPRLAARLPELVSAQRQLRRTERRHGWAATFDATAAATGICVDLRFSGEHRPLWTRWQQRLDLLMPTGYSRSLFIAAIYPEVCALAAVVAANRHPVVPVDARGAEQIISAAGQALDSVGIGSEIRFVVLPRLTTAISGPLLGPAGSYPQTGHHDDGRPRIADSQRQAELGTANRFARDRRAPRPHSRAAPLPYSHRPVEAGVDGGRPR